MANFEALKTLIRQYIKENGDGEITGDILQSVLIAMVTEVEGNGYVYAGIATPTTEPVTGNVFYIATEAGSYSNFGSVDVSAGITILKRDGTSWTKNQISYTDGVFDISAYNGSSYADLSAALGTNGANVPLAVRKGGMSVKFVTTSDNLYHRYNLLTEEFSTVINDWVDNDNIIIRKTIDFSNAQFFTGGINTDNGKVDNSVTNLKYTKIDVSEYKIIKLSVFKTQGVFGSCFYKSDDTPILPGLKETVSPIGTIKEYNIPSDAKYILYTVSLQEPYISLIGEGDEIVSQNNDTLSDLEDYTKHLSADEIGLLTTIDNISTTNRIINTSTNKWVTTTSDISSYLFGAIKYQGKTIRITTSTDTYIALLNQNPIIDTVVSYCSGTHNTIISGIVDLVVPDDCVMIIVYAGINNSINVTFQELQKTDGILNTVKNNIDPVFFKSIIKNEDLLAAAIDATSNKWTPEVGQRCYLIDANSFIGKKIKITTKYLTRYALLSSIPVAGQVVSYCNKFNNLLFEGEVSFEIPSNCLYIYAYDGNNTSRKGVNISAIDYNIDIYEELSQIQSKIDYRPNYHLIFEDNFDNPINTELWKPVNFISPTYGSRFFADDKNWYSDSGCMVLKLDLRDGIYYGPYISTASTFAISRGRIETRMRVTNNTTNIGWCFWLFGQNANWPYAFELDFLEKIANETQNKTHFHYVDTNGDAQDAIRTPMTINTNWHDYVLEWNEERINTYLDGDLMDSTLVSDLNMINQLNYPQQLCFNIKCSRGYNEGNAFLFIDYVRVYTDIEEPSPLQEIIYEDKIMSVGDTLNINPTFLPISTVNKAFRLTSSDESIVSVQEFLNEYENHYLPRKITAVSAGTATLTMTSASGAIVGTFNVTVE